MEKKFKPFDKVLVRDEEIFPEWTCDFYSHYNSDIKHHVTSTMPVLHDEDILPYEGNEHLVGSQDSPDKEVRLEEGEWVFLCDSSSLNADNWSFARLHKIIDNTFQSKHTYWHFAIRFSDFNPNDMEETSRHILCVKNGKIIRYKG